MIGVVGIPAGERKALVVLGRLPGAHIGEDAEGVVVHGASDCRLKTAWGGFLLTGLLWCCEDFIHEFAVYSIEPLVIYYGWIDRWMGGYL